MRRQLLIWSIVSIILLVVGCKTVADGSIHVPQLTLERPERPYLEGSYEEMVRQLIMYSEDMELYADRLEQYIDELDRILNEG